MCHEVQKQLDPQNRAHRPIIDELQERMADKMYVNFSLFQSMPDAWGIDQLFPVLPLEGLDQVPERRAVLLDITCDSDGAIDHYIDGDGIATTMPMPEYDPENPPMLGFFMVGAYQEILGNMHNLFGDTEAVDVFVFPDGSVEVELSDEGDTVADMLQYVHGNGIHSYLVDMALGEWFAITSPEDANAYIQHSGVSLENVKRALYKRSRPERPTYD